MSDELLAVASALNKAVKDNQELIGNEESPTSGDATLQRQHKTIELLLANLTGGVFHTVDDVAPEEHMFSRLWEAVQNTTDITLDENNFITMLIPAWGTSTSMTIAKLDPDTGVLTEGAGITLPEAVDQTYGALLIERCGTKYAIMYHKMAHDASGSLSSYSETASKIYVFSSGFSYESTIDVSSLYSGYGLRGMGWDGTYLQLLLHQPNVFGDFQYGFRDTFSKIDLAGNIIDDTTIDLTGGQTAISVPVLNKITSKQKLAVNADDNEIYLPKILFAYMSSRIWAVNGAGTLLRIFRFSDMLGGVIAGGNKFYNLNTVVTSCLYKKPYLWLLLRLQNLYYPIIARTRINFGEEEEEE
jgi:hypothetical protein